MNLIYQFLVSLRRMGGKISLKNVNNDEEEKVYRLAVEAAKLGYVHFGLEYSKEEDVSICCKISLTDSGIAKADEIRSKNGDIAEFIIGLKYLYNALRGHPLKNFSI